MKSGYRHDLAYIHDVGHSDIARQAACRLVKELKELGAQNGTVVDLGCGGGILASRLSEAGYQVTGIDSSEAMIAIARHRNPQAEFRVGSFTSEDLPRCIAVTAIGEVLNYTFDEGNNRPALEELFRRAYQALAPGGLLLFDMKSADRAISDGKHRTFSEGPDWAVLVRTEFDETRQVLTRHITSFREVEGSYRRDSETHHLLLIDPPTVLESLHSIGFQAEILPSYGQERLPIGLVVFMGRKLDRSAV